MVNQQIEDLPREILSRSGSPAQHDANPSDYSLYQHPKSNYPMPMPRQLIPSEDSYYNYGTEDDLEHEHDHEQRYDASGSDGTFAHQ
jgi:hypothetical protein